MYSQILYFISSRVFTVRHHRNRSQAISLQRLIKNDAGSPHEEHAWASFASFRWRRMFRTVLTSLQGPVHFTVLVFLLELFITHHAAPHHPKRFSHCGPDDDARLKCAQRKALSAAVRTEKALNNSFLLFCETPSLYLYHMSPVLFCF